MAMDPTLALSSPPPAQLPPAFPLQTAESRDRLTASWVTMNSVEQCWKVCWVVCWTVLGHHGCLACFSFCCNTCELEPRDGPRASVFPCSSKRQQGSDCLFFCESPSVCLSFCRQCHRLPICILTSDLTNHIYNQKQEHKNSDCETRSFRVK